MEARATPAETRVVLELIERKFGRDAARDWLWSCTPYPAGMPSPSQLEEGRQVADGTITLGGLMAKVEREIDEAMKNRPWIDASR